MHIQHLKGIPQTIPKDHTDDHETCTVSKKQTNKQKTLSFPSLPTTTAKKPIPTFCHCRPPQFTFCHREPTLYLKTFTLKHPSLNRLKFPTYPRYTVIIKRF